MDMFVFLIVYALLGTSLLSAITACWDTPNYVSIFRAGLASCSLGAAVLIAALYTKLPCNQGEGYFAPLLFLGVGCTFLVVSAKQYIETPEIVSLD